MDETKMTLRDKIRELEEFLDFVIIYQIPFSEGGYSFLNEQLLTWKTELAKLENEQRSTTRKLITSN